MKANTSPSNRSMPVLDDDNGVVKVVRDQPPEHCILHIKSFSVLQVALSNSECDYIDSAEFTAGGYTWVLSVYPNGNVAEDGGGHLSLYVTLIDKLDDDTLINASLRFFIYDQIRDNYLTLLDVGQRLFHALKITSGISKVLPIDSFTDASNGFLVNDCCSFGAGVLVNTDSKIITSILSPVSRNCDRSYTWKIENFSDFSNCRICSPVFSFGDDEWSWKLHLYPRGYSSAKGKYLSLFLVLDNADSLTNGRVLYTEFYLCIKNQDRKEADHTYDGYALMLSSWSSSSSNCPGGCPSFISISDLYSTSNGFLVDDTLIIEVVIQVMLLRQDTDPIKIQRKRLNR